MADQQGGGRGQGGSPAAGAEAVSPGEWVLLSYRMPREPSTARIAVWRGLKRLGVAQISDGLVALPADARTRELLDWVAEEVTEGGGSAGVWLARPATVAQERELASAMASTRAEEYRKVTEEADGLAAQPEADRQRAVRRLRAELRRIGRRDYFPTTARDHARAAVERLAAQAPAAAPEKTTESKAKETSG